MGGRPPPPWCLFRLFSSLKVRRPVSETHQDKSILEQWADQAEYFERMREMEQGRLYDAERLSVPPSLRILCCPLTPCVSFPFLPPRSGLGRELAVGGDGSLLRGETGETEAVRRPTGQGGVRVQQPIPRTRHARRHHVSAERKGLQELLCRFAVQFISPFLQP